MIEEKVVTPRSIGRRNWPMLIAGTAITTIAALSVHAVMLQGLGVPYPADGAAPGWARFLNTGGSIIAAFIFYDLARPRLERWNGVMQCAILFVLYAALMESLRGFLMNGFVSTAWTFSAVQALPRLLLLLVASIIIVLVAPRLKGKLAKAAGSIAIAAIVFFVAKPLADAVFGQVLASIRYLAHEDVYQVPYGWQVLIPAYITFIEPVIASFTIAALVWDRLPAGTVIRFSAFVGLIVFMKASVFRTLVFSFYIKLPLYLAMLSESQFALETLTLAVLTAIIWQSFSKYDLPARTIA